MDHNFVTGDPDKYLFRLRGLLRTAGVHLDIRNLPRGALLRMKRWHVTLAPGLSEAEEFLLLAFAIALLALHGECPLPFAAAHREHAAVEIAHHLSRLIGLYPASRTVLHRLQGATSSLETPFWQADILLMALAEALEPFPIWTTQPRWQSLRYRITKPYCAHRAPLYGASVRALLNGPGAWSTSWANQLSRGPLDHAWPSASNGRWYTSCASALHAPESSMSTRDEQKQSIKCPKCKRKGVIHYSERDHGGASNSDRRVDSTEGGFSAAPTLGLAFEIKCPCGHRFEE